MLFLRALALLSQIALGALAVQENLAGVLDWHKAYVGTALPASLPLRSGPSLETFKLPDGAERTSIVTLTRSNVAASLSVDDGSIEWRHQFPLSELVHSYFVSENALVLVTVTASGNTARYLNALTGSVIWETSLTFAVPDDLQMSSADALFASENGEAVVYLLVGGGQTIVRLKLADGSSTAVWSKSDDSLLLEKLIETPSGVAALGRHVGVAFEAFVLHSLDTLTPSLSSTSATVLSSGASDPSDTTIATPSAVAWLEYDTGDFWVKDLTGAGSSAKQELSGRSYSDLLSVGLDREGIFVGVWSGEADETDRFDILEIVDGKIQVTAAVKTLPLAEDFVRPIGTGAALEIVHQNVNSVYAVHVYGKEAGVAGGYTLPVGEADVEIKVTAAGDLLALSVTPTGALSVFKNKTLLFTREEALSNIRSLTFVDLPEAADFADDALSSSSFFIRHLAQLKHTPDYLLRFVSQYFASTSDVIAPHATHNGALNRDAFGIRKVIVAATKSGAVFGLDSLDGSVLWTYLPNGLERSESEENVRIEGTWLIKPAATNQAPTVAVLMTEFFDGKVRTTAVELDALTGLPKNTASTLFTGTPAGAFLIESAAGSGSKTLRVMSKDGLTVFWPDEASDKDRVGQVTIASAPHAPFKLEGFGGEPTNGSIQLLWQLSLREGERLSRRSTPNTASAVASLGKVTGDRSVMYKYLNPHLIALSTVSPASSSATVYVVDTSRGSIVYETTHRDVDVSSPVEILLVENWLVYAFRSHVGDLAGAQHLVSLEMYESDAGQRKLKSPELSTASAEHVIRTFSSTYLLAHGVRSLGVTETRHGITAKDLIIANDADQIVTIPRRGLDPRRPLGPPSAADKQEMLVPYEPYMPQDPKRVISHRNEVLGISAIYSSPALLESTSIVLASGLDLFQTRVMPSGGFDVLPDSFNKLQLVLTIMGLTAGIVVTRPIVAKRKLRAKWY